MEVIYFNPLFVSPSNHKYDIQDYDYIDPHYGKIVMDDGEVLAPEGCKGQYPCNEVSSVSVTGYQRESGSQQPVFCRAGGSRCISRGMKVILDGVFNHCGSFNKWMDRERIYEPQPDYEKGAYVSADSPYRSFF